MMGYQHQRVKSSRQTKFNIKGGRKFRYGWEQNNGTKWESKDKPTVTGNLKDTGRLVKPVNCKKPRHIFVDEAGQMWVSMSAMLFQYPQEIEF